MTKKRNGWLTAWLVLMIIANVAVALYYIFMGDTISRALPGLPGWTLPVCTVLLVFNIVCTAALFMWKKWGFWGLCVSAIIAFIVNIASGLGITPSILGLLSPIILYGILHVGKEDKGWPQLD